MMVPDQHKILAISSDKDLKEKNEQSAAKQGLNEYPLHFTFSLHLSVPQESRVYASIYL
jgi:hypothetical protein